MTSDEMCAYGAYNTVLQGKRKMEGLTLLPGAHSVLEKRNNIHETSCQKICMSNERDRFLVPWKVRGKGVQLHSQRLFRALRESWPRRMSKQQKIIDTGLPE